MPLKFIASIILILFLSAQAAERRAQTVLDEMYNEISKRHYNDNFANDYRTVYLKHQPEIISSKNDIELAARLNALLSEFGDSHLYIQPPYSTAIRQAMEQSTPLHVGETGIELLETSNWIVIKRVKNGSAGAQAGLRPGMVVKQINGVNIKPENKDNNAPWLAIALKLLSTPGSDGKIAVKLMDNDKPQEVLLTPSGQTKITRMANNIPVRAVYHSELRQDGIGYISFNFFALDLIRRIREDILNKFQNTPALIIDLRGNSGGEIISIEWLANWLIPRKINIGSMLVKKVPLYYVSNPQPQSFKGRLAVIIDRNSLSAAEIFAAAVQDAKAGKLYGETSGGQSLPSIFITLPSGFRLQTLTGEVFRPSGGKIEKIGVTPDMEVQATPQDLAKGHDAPVEHAAADLQSDF